jgi:hypothetical protein
MLLVIETKQDYKVYYPKSIDTIIIPFKSFILSK